MNIEKSKPEMMKPIRVLTIDGGGMRGLYTASYLDHLANDYQRIRGGRSLDIGSAFDLIVGTSTGAILACALATGRNLSLVRSIYKEKGKQIFPEKLPKGIVGVILQMCRRPRLNKEGANVLRSALRDVFGSTTLGDVWASRKIGLCIPAVELGYHRARVFKTNNHPGLDRRDDGLSLVDVCMASSAAPIFRSLESISGIQGGGPPQVFVDGGLWANNPVLVGLIEALEIRGDNLQVPIEVFSIGTCPTTNGSVPDQCNLDWGFAEWQFGGKAASISIDAQAYAYEKAAEKLSKWVPNTSVYRFPSYDVPVSAQPFLELDETSAKGMEVMEDLGRNHSTELRSSCVAGQNLTAKRLHKLFNEDIPEKA